MHTTFRRCNYYEKDLSAQKEKKSKNTWLSCKNEDKKRKKYHKQQKKLKKKKTHSVSFSLGPEKRIKKNKDFQNVFLNGKSTMGEWLICKCVKNDFGYARLGIVVSRKFGKAHVRNRFKRYVRETFRATRVEKSVDVVILPKRELKEVFEEMSFFTFFKELKVLLMNLKENFGES